VYYRFQTKVIDLDSGRPKGILVAASELRDSNNISIEGESWLRNHLDYYNQNLPVPECLNDWEHRRALSWFVSGSDMINRVWELAAFMEENDIFIDTLSTHEPGIIIYQDEHQVVAKPQQKYR